MSATPQPRAPITEDEALELCKQALELTLSVLANLAHIGGTLGTVALGTQSRLLQEFLEAVPPCEPGAAAAGRMPDAPSAQFGLTVLPGRPVLWWRGARDRRHGSLPTS